MGGSWQERRQLQALWLKQQARKTGSVADSLVWERHVRLTSQMETTAAALALLDAAHRVEHGFAISYRGEPVYLEHVVTGPSGIYLIIHVDENQETWRREVAQRLALFRDLLGKNSHSFTCLLLPHAPLRSEAPEGAHAVDSAEIAVQVIREPAGVPVAPSVSDQLWSTLKALTQDEAAASRQASLAQPPAREPNRTSRLAWITIAVAVAANTTCATAFPKEEKVLWWVGSFLLVLPVAAIVGVVQLLPWENPRRYILIGLIGLLCFLGLFFLLFHQS